MSADVVKIRQGRTGKYYDFKRAWFGDGLLGSRNFVYNILRDHPSIDRVTLPTTDDAPDYLLPLELHARGERWDFLVTSRELMAYQQLYKTFGFDCMLPTLALIEKRNSEGVWTWITTSVYQQLGWSE